MLVKMENKKIKLIAIEKHREMKDQVVVVVLIVPVVLEILVVLVVLVVLAIQKILSNIDQEVVLRDLKKLITIIKEIIVIQELFRTNKTIINIKVNMNQNSKIQINFINVKNKMRKNG